MPSLQTTFKSGWITDLVLPAPVGIQSHHDVLTTGQAIAYEMCSDPIFMTHLNPLIQKVEEISTSHPKRVDYLALAKDFKVDLSNTDDALDGEPGAWKHYAITDKLNVLPGYSTDLVYYSAIRRTKSGMEALTNPGSGVTIYGKFAIQIANASDAKALDASDGRGWVVNFLETNELKCNVMLSYYIKATTDKSHRQAHGRFKELWRERMKERGFECMA